MEFGYIYLILAAVVGFFMAFGVGANDVANAIGTSVGAKALSIRQAIIVAIIFESLGALLAGSTVTDTIRHSVIDSSSLSVNNTVLIFGMISASLSAGIWLITASNLGWPVSTTHSLIGAVIGFGVVAFGFNGVQWGVVGEIVVSWLASPILAGIVSFSLFHAIQKFIFNNNEPLQAAKSIIPFFIFASFTLIIKYTVLPGFVTYGADFSVLTGWLISSFLSLLVSLYVVYKINKISKSAIHQHRLVESYFSALMIFTACTMAFAHGSNDVANATGPVAAVVDAVYDFTVETPFWVTLIGVLGIIFGLTFYGYKIIATIGENITTLTPSRAFAAEISAALVVIFASNIGMPVSTTQTLVGSILGVGLAKGISAINIQVIRNIFFSWIITLPVGALLSVICYLTLTKLFM